jgi:hypothetical protein
MSGTTGEGAGLTTLAAISVGVLGMLTARAMPDRLVRPLRLAPSRKGRWNLRQRPKLPPPLEGGGWGRGRDATAAVAARHLNTSSALLSLSVLADSGVEHYRGMFHNKAMYVPLAVAAATLATSLHGVQTQHGEAHQLRRTVAATAAATGLLGGGFHLYNVTKREGGLSWVNLFYGAPLGAPYALILAGLMGTAAEHVRDSRGGRLKLFGMRAGPTLSALSAGGLAGTVAEAALLHFRGAFHNPFMFAPVTIPPVAAGLIAKAGIEAGRGARPRWPRLTRLWLWLTAALGFAGCGFHIYGVSRNMGGWRNWSQNVLNGPPIPAPPSFTGLALAGLAALDLLEERH